LAVPQRDEYIIAAKGAPESIADLCHFTEVQQRELDGRINALASMGLRVLGVAKAQFLKTTPLPSEQHEFTFEFLGLVGLADPVRPQVPQAVQECYTAGIRVIMITDDYPGTAQNIAQQIGLTPQAKIITGTALDEVSEETLQERIKTVSIFARTVPEQKLRLVRALKANGDVVAMTGDGVNDAPAMKAADIGVAMGGRGTDVAREASALVLLNDDFSSIVHAIKLGRRIYDNIKKAMAYIVAIHVPIAGVVLFPVLFNWPLILLPVHIVFLELIIDPACSIVFEAEPAELNVMNRPPRNPQAPLFTRQALSVSLFQGLSILLLVMFIHNTAAHYGLSENAARTVAFTTLVIANLCLIISVKSWASSIISVLHTRNVALWYVVGGALTFLAGALYIPILQDIFRFAPLSIGWIIASVAIGMSSLVLFELVKMLARRYIKE
jgi:Ca2+-transporting ATPase